jgi:hypothetical protein
MDLKRAYEVLGLPEDATREQVEQKYFLLLKKAKAQQIELDEITLAYKTIVGVELEKASTEKKQGRISYFFYYYKFHLMIAIIVVIAASFTIKDYIDRKNEEASKPPLDLTVTLFGNFYSPDGTDPELAANLLALVPEWKRIDVSVHYMPKELRSEQDMALQQKSMLILMTEKLDLMILNEKTFDQFARQGAFMPLDSLSFWAKLKDDKRVRSALPEDAAAPRPYGVDITDTPLLKGTSADVPEERKILAIRFEPQHREQAIRMLELLVLPR